MFVKDNQPTLRADLEALFERHAAVAPAGTAPVRTGVPAAPVGTGLGLACQKVRVVGEARRAGSLRHAATHDVGHGRIERRQLAALQVPVWLDWPGADQVFRLQRDTRFKKDGRHRGETVYGITSLPAAQAAPSSLLQLCRGHWSIENRSHWVRDVTFDEDRSTVHRASIPQVMAALRNTVIGVLRVRGHTNIAAACRSYAAHASNVISLIRNPLTFE
jgi:predicted transposase YbfD/YdcC